MTSKGHHWIKTPDQVANSTRAKMGHPVSVETRRRLSEAAKKHNAAMTPEQKVAQAAKASVALKGRPKSPQWREHILAYQRNRPASHNQHIADALRGKKCTPEHIANQRKAKLTTGFWKPIGHTYIAQGYRWIKVSHGGTKDNYRAEHRLVLEKELGRPLLTDEHVHHIDGNRLNNDLSNLALVSKQEHALLTKLLRVVDHDLARTIALTLRQRFPDLG